MEGDRKRSPSVGVKRRKFLLLYYCLCFPRHNFTALQRRPVLNNLSPRGRRDNMPPPLFPDGSSTRGGSTSVGEWVRSPHVTKLQAASVPIAYGSCAPRSAVPWDRPTDKRTHTRYRLTPLPLQRGHNNVANDAKYH